MMLLAAALLAAAPVRIEVTDALVAQLPREQVTLTQHDETLACEGPTLASVLIKAGVPSGADVHGAALRQAVMARASDGYSVLFSLGEIDAKLGNAMIVVADRCNGKPLASEDGHYRLAVSGDQRGARSVRQLIALEIISID